MTIASPTLQDFDPELAQAMRAEAMRQEDHAELIASENYASPLVMAVQDSVFTNKYAEGYPGRRYYSGCEHVDVAERLALERVKALFDCDYANVQPHAGAQANAAVFLSADAARRHRHGHESGAGRPPDPWQSVHSRAGTITSCPTAWIPRPG